MDKPKLLIEYVYLITHGQMLSERLKEQIRQFKEQSEDQVKIEILRRVSAAHSVGVPLEIEKMVGSLAFKDDPQLVLSSMEDEYIKTSDGYITGLHWIRSKHLFEQLHDQYPTKKLTLENTFCSVPKIKISDFISNSFSILSDEYHDFLSKIADKIDADDLEAVVECLNGAFRAGEINFFRNNKKIFDQIRQGLNPACGYLLMSDSIPSVKKDIIDGLSKIGGNVKQRSEEIKEYKAKMIFSDRGIIFVIHILKLIAPKIQEDILKIPCKALGYLLDWCAFTDIKLPAWNGKVKEDKVFSLEAEALSNWLLGIYRYDQKAYKIWLQQAKEQLIKYMMAQLELTKLTVDEDLSIIFFVKPELSPNKQAVSRLEILRSVFPFCRYYCSKGIWFILEPSNNETIKEIPAENLPFNIDVNKNVIFRTIYEDAYRPENYYEFQERWKNAREIAYKLVQLFTEILKCIISGQKEPEYIKRSLGSQLSLFADSFDHIPELLPIGANKELKETFNGQPKKWTNSISNFIRFLCDYAIKKDNKAGRYSLLNLRSALSEFPGLHKAFEILLMDSMDYFNSKKLATEEVRPYRILAELLDCVLNFPPSSSQSNPMAYINSFRKKQWHNKQEKLKKVQAALLEDSITIELPCSSHYEHPLTYIGFLVHVTDKLDIIDYMQIIASKLIEYKDIANFFYFIPICNNVRWMKEGYRISNEKLQDWIDDTIEQWELIAPQEIPDEVIKSLPFYPLIPNKDNEIESLYQGLIMVLESLPEIWSHIEPYKASDCVFENQLFEKLKQYIDNYIDDLIQMAKKMLDIIKNNSDDSLSTEIQVKIQDICNKILNAKDIENILHFIESQGFLI